MCTLFAFCLAQEPVQSLVPTRRSVGEQSSLAVRTVRLHPGSPDSTSPTNLSTLALAKPEEWKLNRNVSYESYSIGVLSPKLHTHVSACLGDISSQTTHRHLTLSVIKTPPHPAFLLGPLFWVASPAKSETSISSSPKPCLQGCCLFQIQNRPELISCPSCPHMRTFGA